MTLKGRRVLVFVIAPLFLTGCDGCIPEPPDEPPVPLAAEAPRAKTPEEVASELLAKCAPLGAYATTLSPQFPIDKELRAQLITEFKNAKDEYSGSEAGEKALGIVCRDLGGRLEKLREEERANLAFLICELIEILDPENLRLLQYREWAEKAKDCPFVVIRGWLEDLEVTPTVVYALLDVYLPETGETERVSVRLGEEFHGLAFREVLGNKSGMVLEYLPTGRRFEVYGPRKPRPEGESPVKLSGTGS